MKQKAAATELNVQDNICVKKRERAFTLVEMAIVVLVSGLFIAMAVKIYSNQMRGFRYNQTIEHMKQTQYAMTEFFFRYGRYPCPADPTLPPGDPMYGREWCPDAPPSPPVSLNITYTSFGARDTDKDGLSNTVAIGILPFKTLDEDVINTPYVIADAYDGYGNVLSYAVSDDMTRNMYSYADPVPPTLGAINVRDANNISVVTPEASAHYVIYSHGETAEGAYNKQGNRRGNCFIPGLSVLPSAGFSLATPGVQVELENCDNQDAIFIKELRAFADTDDFNDDILYYGINMQAEIWRVSAFSPSTDTYYYNTNPGGIGVGVTTPTSILYISGDVRAESQIKSTNGFCPLTYSGVGDCVDPEFLGGSGFTCPDGEVAIGIENNQLVCVPLLSSSPSFVGYCSAGSYMTGFSLSVDSTYNNPTATPICSP